jgi:hypothetical protein
VDETISLWRALAYRSRTAHRVAPVPPRTAPACRPPPYTPASSTRVLHGGTPCTRVPLVALSAPLMPARASHACRRFEGVLPAPKTLGYQPWWARMRTVEAMRDRT